MSIQIYETVRTFPLYILSNEKRSAHAQAQAHTLSPAPISHFNMLMSMNRPLGYSRVQIASLFQKQALYQPKGTF